MLRQLLANYITRRRIRMANTGPVVLVFPHKSAIVADINTNKDVFSDNGGTVPIVNGGIPRKILDQSGLGNHGVIDSGIYTYRAVGPSGTPVFVVPALGEGGRGAYKIPLNANMGHVGCQDADWTIIFVAYPRQNKENLGNIFEMGSNGQRATGAPANLAAFGCYRNNFHRPPFEFDNLKSNVYGPKLFVYSHTAADNKARLTINGVYQGEDESNSFLDPANLDHWYFGDTGQAWGFPLSGFFSRIMLIRDVAFTDDEKYTASAILAAEHFTSGWQSIIQGDSLSFNGVGNFNAWHEVLYSEYTAETQMISLAVPNATWQSATDGNIFIPMATGWDQNEGRTFNPKLNTILLAMSWANSVGSTSGDLTVVTQQVINYFTKAINAGMVSDDTHTRIRVLSGFLPVATSGANQKTDVATYNAVRTLLGNWFPTVDPTYPNFRLAGPACPKVNGEPIATHCYWTYGVPPFDDDNSWTNNANNFDGVHLTQSSQDAYKDGLKSFFKGKIGV